MTQPLIKFSDGNSIPQLGFGVWQVPSADAAPVVAKALEVGYRSIDTAQMYGNEQGVGEAVRTSGLDRDEVFVTTKLDNGSHGRDAALRAFDGSLKALGMDVVDLFLIHWPLPKRDRYVETWQAFIELREQGAARSIGVSNFQQHHLHRLIDETSVTPVLNQVELHPYLTQQSLRDFHAAHGIATEAWSPLGSGGPVLRDPVIVSLAEKYGRTPAQVILAWHLAIGNVVIPKSVTPARIAENFDVFDIDLDGDDVAAISALNKDERTGGNPDHVG